MSKRKRKATAASAPKAVQPARSSSTPSAPPTKPIGNRWRAGQFGLLALIVVLAGGLYYLWWQTAQPKPTQNAATPSLQRQWLFGRTDTCKRKPDFANALRLYPKCGHENRY